MGVEMRGRRRTPTKLIRLRGNPGKLSLNEISGENEPKPETSEECPKYPDLLVKDKYAKKMWKKYAPVLHRAGLLTEADVHLLAVLCQNKSRLFAAQKLREQHGAYIQTPGANDIRRAPWMTEIDSCVRTITSLVGHFGMSPSVRSRMNVENLNPKRPNKLNELRKRKSAGQP